MNEQEKKELMSETKATQAEIDAHKPSKGQILIRYGHIKRLYT